MYASSFATASTVGAADTRVNSASCRIVNLVSTHREISRELSGACLIPQGSCRTQLRRSGEAILKCSRWLARHQGDRLPRPRIRLWPVRARQPPMRQGGRPARLLSGRVARPALPKLVIQKRICGRGTAVKWGVSDKVSRRPERADSAPWVVPRDLRHHRRARSIEACSLSSRSGSFSSARQVTLGHRMSLAGNIA